MVPPAYATPVAVILVVGGLLACFAGYRLFRVVLGIYGFIFGAVITTSIMGASNTFALAVAAVVGGLVGAVLMIAAYFIGVGLVGAGLAVLLLGAGWHAIAHTDPPTLALIIVAVVGALLALSVVRYVVVFGTSLSGSWTALMGALALSGSRPLTRGGSADALMIYPTDSRMWVLAAWLGLALVGIVVQLATTTRTATRKPKVAKKV